MNEKGRLPGKREEGGGGSGGMEIEKIDDFDLEQKKNHDSNLRTKKRTRKKEKDTGIINDLTFHPQSSICSKVKKKFFEKTVFPFFSFLFSSFLLFFLFFFPFLPCCPQTHKSPVKVGHGQGKILWKSQKSHENR